MKVVLDTNVFISAIFWKGPPRRILRYAENGLATIVSSEETLQELFGVLKRKKFQPYFQQARITRQQVAADVLNLVYVCSPTETINTVKQDPSDNIFLACALAASADFIVSGDKHLLALKSFQNIPILTPRQFLNRLKKQAVV